MNVCFWGRCTLNPEEQALWKPCFRVHIVTPSKISATLKHKYYKKLVFHVETNLYTSEKDTLIY